MADGFLSRRNLLKGALGMSAVSAFSGMAQANSNWVYSSPSPESLRHPVLASKSTDPVGVQLVLVLDSSDSMDVTEYNIQRSAHANAFKPRMGQDKLTGRNLNGLIEAAIRYKAGDRSIAVCVIDFADVCEVRVPWVDFRESDPDLERKMSMFSSQVAGLRRIHGGRTNIRGVLNDCHFFLEHCPWTATERKVVDICSDGVPRPPFDWLMEERDHLSNTGVTINVLAIVNEKPNIEAAMNEMVVTRTPAQGRDGIWSEPGRVWVVARNIGGDEKQPYKLADFSRQVEYAIKAKISTEIAGIKSVPGSMQHQREFAALFGDNAPQLAKIPALTVIP